MGGEVTGRGSLGVGPDGRVVALSIAELLISRRPSSSFAFRRRLTKAEVLKSGRTFLLSTIALQSNDWWVIRSTNPAPRGSRMALNAATKSSGERVSLWWSPLILDSML